MSAQLWELGATVPLTHARLRRYVVYSDQAGQAIVAKEVCVYISMFTCVRLPCLCVCVCVCLTMCVLCVCVCVCVCVSEPVSVCVTMCVHLCPFCVHLCECVCVSISLYIYIYNTWRWERGEGPPLSADTTRTHRMRRWWTWASRGALRLSCWSVPMPTACLPSSMHQVRPGTGVVRLGRGKVEACVWVTERDR